ncbi:MAG TPA: glycosyltransferase family 2 protein [Candidatus Polarisedimenticolia bacterium]|jgi:glycosyltransferase involved in cell wall biosynthesis|nr:glycosyltransferase family 2 protein [Dongiaceae bacterium]HYV88248.1 glycosyltransferase family 2 protein [Candidatus Polarisedimenticolia bacterium]
MSGGEIELTILMPCLNEAATVGRCVEKAKGYLARAGVSGEILIADNGSTDGSQGLAEAAGARVIAVERRGYGAALQAGIAAARGRYVIMGDADDSYDFSDLDGFLSKLRAGNALVMGNRFKGGIRPGAMPFLNRYLGNPVLSFIGVLFFKSASGDFHCGLRGFERKAILDLGLFMPGMEFASEMVVKAAVNGLRIAEVPIVLHPDGRGRPPHLRPWRDGWRHLKFLLMHSPRWLYLYPGLIMAFGGLGLMTLLALAGSISLGGIVLQAHSMLAAGVIGLLGVQTLSFAVLARQFAVREGYLPSTSILDRVRRWATMEKITLTGVIVLLAGLAGLLISALHWAALGFGALDYARTMRSVVPSLVAMGVGLQLVLSGFLSGILDLPRIRDRR